MQNAISTRVSRFTHGQGFHSGKVSAQAQFIPLNLIAQKKKGEPWPKSFTFSSLEGHSDPPPLQVPNTITLISQDRLCSVTEHAMLLRCFLELILSAKKG